MKSLGEKSVPEREWREGRSHRSAPSLQRGPVSMSHRSHRSHRRSTWGKGLMFMGMGTISQGFQEHPLNCTSFMSPE